MTLNEDEYYPKTSDGENSIEQKASVFFVVAKIY